MKTVKEIQKILSKFTHIDSHVHTCLCDGQKEMTVDNIARCAAEKGLECIVLTPHFHKRVSDTSATLYEDSDENIFLTLREQIDSYERRDGGVKFLLSAEADILSLDGDISLDISAKAENSLDFVSPTLNYHPLLPLDFVKLTYGRCVNGLHESGEYLRTAEACGGIEYILETVYRTQVNAIQKCSYPAMLGHFFMPHSIHPDTYSCFGARQEHLNLMKEGAKSVIHACRENNVMMDLTGVHLHPTESVSHRIELNGFLADFQRFVISECLAKHVPFYYGSDAHSLSALGGSHGYYESIIHSVSNGQV